MGAVRSGLGCLSWVGAGIIVIALILKVALFDMAEVGHNGMAPTLLRGERVLINKRAKLAQQVAVAAVEVDVAEAVDLRQDRDALGGDLLLLASLFVLGGDFWDKIRSLFIYDAKADFSKEK